MDDDSLPEDLIPELLALAVDAARSASELILSGFRSPSLTVEIKQDGSPVTPFDRQAEQTVRAFIQANQPRDWPILGEEFGGDTEDAKYRWVVDPIDGTLGFARGLLGFGTLLAFEDVPAQRALIGVIHLPAFEETYSAARGEGAWCGGERMHVSPARELRNCLVSAPAEEMYRLTGTGGPGRPRPHIPTLRSYSDCWAHAMVARGSIDALAEYKLARWDIAATEVLVEEAGGRVLLRPARDAPPGVKGKCDVLLGSPQAAAALSELLDF